MDDGFSVSTANNGIAGIELFKRESFDLVITDINMPGMSGFDVIKRINNIIMVPIILMSSDYLPVDPDDVKRLCVNAIISKTINDYDFCELIRHCLEDEDKVYKSKIFDIILRMSLICNPNKGGIMKTKTIMIVDDEQPFHDRYSEMLEDSDYEIISAYGGDEALSILGGKRPDLIITDITLNMMTGDTLFLFIKSMPEYKDIPFIMASDFSPQPYVHLKRVDPDLVFLDKTFTREELVKKVRARIG